MRDIRASFVLPLLFLGVVVQVPMTLAQSAQTFSATGNMTTPRIFHTATLLPNGKVLIAGGADKSYQALTNAELYDPATGTFAPTGRMVTGRLSSFTATLLPDGTVLMSGGLAKFTPAEAQLIQPLMAHSPFFAWLYGVTSVQGASIVIGTNDFRAVRGRTFTTRRGTSG